MQKRSDVKIMGKGAISYDFCYDAITSLVQEGKEEIHQIKGA
jgi:hypothetical protein